MAQHQTEPHVFGGHACFGDSLIAAFVSRMCMVYLPFYLNHLFFVLNHLFLVFHIFPVFNRFLCVFNRYHAHALLVKAPSRA